MNSGFRRMALVAGAIRHPGQTRVKGRHARIGVRGYTRTGERGGLKIATGPLCSLGESARQRALCPCAQQRPRRLHLIVTNAKRH